MEKSDEPVLSDTVTIQGDSQTNNADDIYHIKWIDWSEDRTPIVTQNENGPCPLLAIFNVLLLSKKITLGDAAEFISSSQIVSRIADAIWNSTPENLPDHERLNYEQTISDAMAVFPNLQTGLDVNVKFSAVSSFEYTSELAVFDLLRIPVYHGWVIDPQDIQTNEILGDLSYNQAVEKVIDFVSSGDEQVVGKGLIAQQFLESTASQITYHGIVSLREEMQPGNLAVLFRNNHFSTIHRHKDELFTLVTDLGFLKERSVVWESLSSVQGDSHFVDGNFVNSPPKNEASLPAESPQSSEHDYQLALSMQQEQLDTPTTSRQPATMLTSDYELARELQRQEEELATQRTLSQGQPRPSSHPSGTHIEQSTRKQEHKSESKCVIL